MVMNASQARVVDPILSNVARGYRNAKFVGKTLFPVVPVQARGGKIIEFGKEAFRRYNSRRAPGSNTKRINFGHEGKPYALHQDALEGQVPFEIMQDANQVPGINLGTRAVTSTLDIQALELECQQAEIARDPDNYNNDHKVDLTAAKWTDDANDPAIDIEVGKDAISDAIGTEPNVLLLSKAAFKAARRNAHVKENFKHTTAKSVTEEMLAEYFDVDMVVVGKGITFDSNDKPQQIWGTDAILAYTAIGSVGNEQPSYAYTYELEGTPLVESTYVDRSAKSWIYPVTAEHSPEITGATAGYLLQNVG